MFVYLHNIVGARIPVLSRLLCLQSVQNITHVPVLSYSYVAGNVYNRGILYIAYTFVAKYNICVDLL